MKSLCKLVTNLLKPTVCAHPINLCNSLGSRHSDLHHYVLCGRAPWLESVINFPFLPGALSWRPSLFPLGELDIGRNMWGLIRDSLTRGGEHFQDRGEGQIIALLLRKTQGARKPSAVLSAVPVFVFVFPCLCVCRHYLRQDGKSPV